MHITTCYRCLLSHLTTPPPHHQKQTSLPSEHASPLWNARAAGTREYQRQGRTLCRAESTLSLFMMALMGNTFAALSFTSDCNMGICQAQHHK